MVSVALSTLAVAVTYMIVRTAFPRRPAMALFATAIHASWPLYLFMGGMLSNDVGISVVGSITTLFVVRLWMKSPGTSRRWDYLGLLVSLICATLTKDNGLALVLFAGLAVGALMLRDLKMRSYRGLVELLYLVALLVILVMLGGLLTNGRSLRQITKAVEISTGVVQRASASLTAYTGRVPGWASVTLSTLFSSYSWGFLNVPVQWLQPVAVAGVIALAGLLIALFRRKTRSIVLLMLLCVACVSLAAVLAGTSAYYHGRVVLPSLSAIVVLITIGLFSLPRLVQRASAGFALATVQMVALMSPVLVMAPEYQKPILLDPIAMPAGLQVPSSLTFGGAIRLLGYSLPSPHTARGQDAAITLYWRALQSLPKDYAIKLELFSVSGESLEAQSQTTPGNNNFPTSFWKPGDTFAETYHLPVSLDAPAPTLATFRITWFGQKTDEVSWYRPQTQDVLPSTCDGAPCEPKVGALPVMLDDAATAQWAGRQALYRLGPHIELIDYQAVTYATAGQTLRVPLVWRATAGNPGDLTTFVHLFGPDGKLAAQSDTPPLNGQYPTRVWSAGEVIPDYYTLPLTSTLEPGVYHLKIGMYDSKTHDRLATTDAAGKALVDNVIALEDVTIGR
jgi:hypothetical protein